MKTAATLAIAVLLAIPAAPASAALPEAGTREAELACVGLTNLAYAGASLSKPPVPQVVTVAAIALGYYLGRLSKVDPAATKKDVDAVIAKLSLEEKNILVNQCMKQASPGMAPLG